MSLYQCEKCGCCENTSCGHYHCRNFKDMWDEKYLGKALCSACAPTHFKSGEKNRDMNGKWHGKFERTFLPMNMFYTNDDGNLAHKETHETDFRKYSLNVKTT